MRNTGKFLAKLWNDETGISSVEYALLLAFVTAVLIIGAEALSDAVGDQMEDTASCVNTGDTTNC
jgi:Flp pilus assembly pilin Flp